uniref:Zinc finger, SWIM-type containing 8 n=1 Tax=Cyprinus carpio TaxID=7962 RepID=A0A8C2L731_CYPCA
MELMFAEWEDGERFSFEDSDRFEEDSLCSFISEAESLCQNWRGWRKQSAGPNSPTVKIKAGTEGTRLLRHGQVIPLVELSAKQVAFHIPFEVVEKVYPPVPEQLQLRISCNIEMCYYRLLFSQTGFHLSATVVSPQAGQSKGAYNVAVMFDRCRITSCSCTCGAGAKWCAHVVALCLFRIHNASAVCLRAPVSESLSRLQRDQLQKFAQYLISELPQQILPTAQRLLDELLSSQSTAINTVCGAPDPTSGPSASDQSTWYLDESTLSDNIKKTVHKFCGPSPVVFSKKMVACLLRPLRGREPEGIWNLLSIVREMFKRRDSNAAPLLEILTEQYLLANPPDLKVEQPQTKGKKSKVSTSKQTQVATNTLSKVAFLLTVLSERLELHNLAFNTGMFSLELQRPPASTKALEVKLAYQESEVVALLKKIPLGLVEMTSIRDRAEQLRDGNFCDYRPVLPLMLASFIFDVLCTPVVSPTGSRPPSRNRNNEMPGDEELGFEAAVAALGMKTTVSEAEHPLLCEGTRREKGDLALALMITYKDDQSKLKKILDKLLDRESQTHKPQTLSSFYSSKPATSSQKSPSKHAAHGASGATGGVSKHTPASAVTGEEGAQSTSCEQQSEAAPFKPEGTVPSRLALGGRGAYGTRCWGSPVRQKKKHTGMASIDSSAPETTSDSSPTLSRRPFRGGWTAASWGRGQDSDSISSSSSDSLGSSSSSGSRRAGGGARAKSTDTSRYKGRRPESHAPHVPNQPSEAAAHFYFELAKTVLIKAGGNSSTSIFTQPSASGGHQGPHRNLHLCAFEIGLYALGLHNFVSPNWLSRTYSSHVSWITGQAMEIGSAALNILVECWDGHLTPPEVASLADRASRARDPNMVRAAAELALSCLPHAHALNPNEIQRALVQCKEQDNVMLEKACMAVEEAAKGGGVYPEVLFEVAHQWYWLYEQTVGGGSGAQREGSGRCRANGGAGRTPPEGSCGILDNTGAMDPSGVAAVTTTVTAAAVVPVISVGSTIYQSHALPGSAMGHAQGLHPYTTIQTHLPTVCTPQYLGHPLQHIPRPAVFPVSGAAYPQGMHPAFIGAQYPFSVATGPHPPMAATAVTFPGVPMPSMTQIAVHPYHTAEALSTTVAAGVHSGSTIQAIQGASHPGLSSQPASLVSAPFPVEDEQHSQPISQQGLHYLHSAYRVGMLALEMLGRRAHNDHPNNFSRSPPYTEDVKWLLGLAARLGVNHVYQFCVGAAKGVLSPFVLQEIIMEALQRLNPAHIHAHLRTPAFHQLVQRCQQAYLQYIHHRLIHLTPADYDDFVNIIRSARGAFCLTPVGMMQFNDVLQNLKRGKQTKELWQRISLEMATFSP